MILCFGGKNTAKGWSLNTEGPLYYQPGEPVRLPLLASLEQPSVTLQVRIIGSGGNISVIEATQENGFLNITLPGGAELCSYPFAIVPLELSREDGSSWRLAVLNPGAPAHFPKCSVQRKNGAPEMVVDGQPLGFANSFVTSFIRDFPAHAFQAVSGMRTAGIRLYQLFFDTRDCLRDGRPDIGRAMEDLTADVIKLALIAGDSLFFIRWHLFMPLEWVNAHPDEAIRDENGVLDIPRGWPHGRHASYASEQFRAVNLELIRHVLQALRESPVADRFTGIQICYGNCGEWNNWGYHEKTFPDFSPSMQRVYGQWLVERYGREALDLLPDPAHPVPTRACRLEDEPPFRDAARNINVIRYYLFWQEYTADTIAFFARAIRQHSGGACFVGAFYGYYLGHYGACPYHFQDSGHYALHRLVSNADIDFVVAPYPYHNRLKNAPVNIAAGTCRTHGAVCLNENDQRTHRSGAEELIYGATASLGESIEVAKRDFMNNLSKKCSYYFFDFQGGWYLDAEFIAAVRRLREIEERFKASCAGFSVQKVKVFVSEQTPAYLSNHSSAVTGQLSEMLLFELDAAGAPWELYTIDDLEDVDLDDCPLAILPNSFYLSQRQREIIGSRLYTPGRTVLYLGLPGVFDEGGLRTDAGIIPSAGLSPDGLRKMYKQMEREDIDNFSVDSLEKSSVNGCRIWHSGFFGLGRRQLREVYDAAGVHVYSRSDGMFYMAGPLMGLYVRNGGRAEIVLPERVRFIQEVYSGEMIGYDLDRFSYTMPEDVHTAIFYVGNELVN